MKEKSEYFDILTGSQFLKIKEGHNVVQIKISDIIYLEALKDYTRLITTQKKHCVLSSIGQILKTTIFQILSGSIKAMPFQNILLPEKTVTKLLSIVISIYQSAELTKKI
jgi:hypothetical protein